MYLVQIKILETRGYSIKQNMHSKVLAMCQIRAKIYQDEININIDYTRECFYSNSILNNQLDEIKIENLEETSSIEDENRNMLIENNIKLEEE
ncbi:12289_t:CDS:2 [Dentiscutata heterogama]|uniref:12289_t:CDS:1 n=1 Tax=Dentiscutata heterogama TaxID=1316150 RepID=A0ACA9MQ32_9GLOM|nr:12289_t:CDS:2 [Dentiscutata heterogama]